MRRTGITSVLGTCLLLLGVGSALAQKAKPIETFDAMGVQMSTGKSSHITITIERWNTAEERQALLNTLKEKGQPALTEALHYLPRVGYIRMPDTMGVDLKYAYSTQLPDGTRRVVVGADRNLTFREAAKNNRSEKYDFAVAELHFPKDGGSGEGKLAPATLIKIDKETNQIELENYQAQPVRLKGIKSKVSK